MNISLGLLPVPPVFCEIFALDYFEKSRKVQKTSSVLSATIRHYLETLINRKRDNGLNLLFFEINRRANLAVISLATPDVSKCSLILPAYARPADAPPDHYELKYLVRPGNRPKPVLVQHASQPGEDLPVGAAHPYPSRQIFNVCAASVGEEALKKSSGSNSLMVTLRPQLGRRASALPLAGTVGVLSARVRFQEGKVLSDVQNTDWLPVQLTPRSALLATRIGRGSLARTGRDTDTATGACTSAKHQRRGRD
eukprot:g12018.t1